MDLLPLETTSGNIMPIRHGRIAAEAIQKYGYAPEHNLDWYLFCGGEYETSRPTAVKKEINIFARLRNGCGLLTKKDKGDIYSVFSEPLAPPKQRGIVLKEYIAYVFKQLGAKKVVLDLRAETRKQLIPLLPVYARALKPSTAYSLTYPVLNLAAFDFSLSGRTNKLLRHTKHKFFREHAVEIIDARTMHPRNLFPIVDKWKRLRRAGGRAACERYYNLIASRFRGAERARVFVVDDHPVGLWAGWPIPNSSFYYLGVVLHNYAVPSVGVLLYLDALADLRGSAYTHVDLGGGDKRITDFKNQFHPETHYATYSFSIVRA